MEFNYNQFMSQSSNQNKKDDNVQNGPYVGYLSLKDGEEAIVRVMCDSVDDIKVLACHWGYLGGRETWINCPRAPQDPVDNCVLCKEGKPLSYRTFIKLIQYVKDEQGNIRALAKIWDRPASFISILKDRVTDYGPLSEILCKIKRHGTGTSTKYDLMPLPQDRYPENVYQKRDNAFEGFNIIGHSVHELPSSEPTTSKDPGVVSEIRNPEAQVSESRYSQAENNNNNSGNPFGRPQRFYQG